MTLPKAFQLYATVACDKNSAQHCSKPGNVMVYAHQEIKDGEATCTVEVYESQEAAEAVVVAGKKGDSASADEKAARDRALAGRICKLQGMSSRTLHLISSKWGGLLKTDGRRTDEASIFHAKVPTLSTRKTSS
jgi:hypothetical protein